MSDKVFLKDYEKTITELYIKNDGSKVTASESNKKIEAFKKKSNNPNKITFKVEMAGDKKSLDKEKKYNIFHSEKNINSNTIYNINNFPDENLSMTLLQDYNRIYDRDNELNRQFEALEDSDAEIFSNLGSNNPSFNRSLIHNDENMVNSRRENNEVNHSILQNNDDSEGFLTTTINVRKGYI